MTHLSNSPPKQQAGGMKTLVLVEDDVSTTAMIDLLLQGEGGYQTTCFISGEEVLANLDTLKTPQPDLFLIDYWLPKMTGLDLYEQVHTTEGFEHVPGLLLTARTISETENQRIVQYHLKVLYKPFDIDDFLDSVQQAVA